MTLTVSILVVATGIVLQKKIIVSDADRDCDNNYIYNSALDVTGYATSQDLNHWLTVYDQSLATSA